MDEVYQSAKRCFEQLEELCIHRATSQEAGLSFEDGCVDWVYIADSYYYEVVAVDLELWHKKLTTPGVLFGDDYHWRSPELEYSVKRAAGEFASLNNHEARAGLHREYRTLV